MHASVYATVGVLAISLRAGLPTSAGDAHAYPTEVGVTFHLKAPLRMGAPLFD